jgi:DNA-binding SARP family transcriptional activator
VAEAIAVRLLGPIEVVGPQGVAELVGVRQRSLVALLALRPGKAMALDRIIDGLWGENPPRTALRTLQSHLARVRQALAVAGLPDVIAGGPAGHMLRLPAEAIDAHVFDDLVRRGRAQLNATGRQGGATADQAKTAARRHSAGTGTGIGANVGENPLREAETLLREALSLWRGEVWQDGEAVGHAFADVQRLQDARLSALEDLCDVRLRLGDHAGAIDDMPQLLAAHPYRERAAGLLMLALYRAGRAADALNVFQRLKSDLADGLGIDPGADLQHLYAAILRQDKALELRPERKVAQSVAVQGIAVPAELPPRVGYFTGRNDEFKGLDKLLAVRASDSDHKVVLISGGTGMGKTALALEWAHHAAPGFPDGQLFLDLQGHDPQTTLGPSAVVSHLLRGMGVPRDRVPVELTEQAVLFRSLVHNRRFLILLDNARHMEQVVPAVPAGESSLLMVTSRQELSALAVRQPVHFVQVEAFDGDTGLDLLRRAVDVERIEAEREAAEEIVTFCGGMPLALRITAARLASRPGLGVAELMSDFRRRELDALAVPGDAAGIRAVFASAYSSLSEPVRRTFRLLSLHPGPSVSVHLAAVATGGTTAEAAAHLAELAGTGLLIPVGERYRFHDLIGLYAAENTRVEETPADIQATISRILVWYEGIAFEANKVLDPARNRVTVAAPSPEPPFGRTHQEVMAFLEGEQPSLGPVVRKAFETGHFDVVWHLTYLVAGFYDSRGSHDSLEMCRLGVRAARGVGDPAAEVLMRNLYAATCVQMRRYDEALAELEPALPLASAAAQDTWLLATTHTNMAVANTWLRRYDAAREAFEHALEIHTGNQAMAEVALSLNNIGDVQRRAGRGEEALGRLSRALEIAQGLQLPRLEAIIRHSMGQAHQSVGAQANALDEFGRALALRRRIGDRRGEANALNEIGTIRLDLGDTGGAIEAFDDALDLSRLLNNGHLEATLHSRLAEALLRSGDRAAAAAALAQSSRLRRQIPDAVEEERLRALAAQAAS